MKSGGGGNWTRVLCDATCYTETVCEGYSVGPSELCREDQALRELVARWQRLTLGLREKIIELARGAT